MKVSICVTAYNQEKYIVEAVESVLAQTIRPFQIIVVDDYSTDNTRAVISSYQSRYPQFFIPIYHTQNTGISQARIDALQIVSGDCVTFLDGDDRFLPIKLEKEISTLQDSQSDMVFSNHFYINSQGERTGIWADTSLFLPDDIFQLVFARDFPKRSLYRSELVLFQKWQQIGYYDPRLNLYEDYEMRIRLSKKLKASYCSELLSEYRLHGSGLSRVPARQHLKALLYIYEKNKVLLDDIPPSDREAVIHKLMDWITPIAFKSITQFFHKNGYRDDLETLLLLWRHVPLLSQSILRRLF